jgi:ADP-L-glycero-D-manno-heptose 6-epimerase
MIVLTGAAGFIGSVILGYLNSLGRDDIIIVDNFNNIDKQRNLTNKKYFKRLSIEDGFLNLPKLEAVIHFGAISNTLEQNWENINRYNLHSTRQWYEQARKDNAKFIFASSAAIYGNGNGPLNHYATSKLLSEQSLNDACVLRLFNVYGPNEYHKGRMASTFYHWYNQSKTEEIKLFENSEQYSRDFIYVEDVAKAVNFMLYNYTTGIFDLGTGEPKSFAYVANIFKILVNCDIKAISMPEDLRKQYQTYSCAGLNKSLLIDILPFHITSVDLGLAKYLEYLKSNANY